MPLFHTQNKAFHTNGLIKRRKFILKTINLQTKIKRVGSKALIISNTNELVRVKPERVVYVESDGNYSTMVLHDRTEHLFTMNLAHCQQLIEKQLGKEAETFIRIGKQLIVNRAYIYKINISRQQLVMADMALNDAFTLQASKEALKQLKTYIESTIGKEAKL
ncbi:MAG: LytTR family transcriptional regulator [Bacteroidaceae bacterium]|nr:LytTR family transcriptional regulator [Bacteroidaceae bacterium]